MLNVTHIQSSSLALSLTHFFFDAHLLCYGYSLLVLGFRRLRRKRCMWLGLGLGIRVRKCLWMIWYIGEWWMGTRLNQKEEGTLSRWHVKGLVLFA
ncbi:hypothetical protein Fmac_008141 [Flemingia macrophylla]|uniref:Transmembrane protein n=1 Tax=Flemingia macrophylla TaxID=520843 RepID=A0ABD1MX37_9FABA